MAWLLSVAWPRTPRWHGFDPSSGQGGVVFVPGAPPAYRVCGAPARRATRLGDNEWVGKTVASGGDPCRGTSGLHRAGWWVTPTRGNPRESATESRPPPLCRREAALGGKGETVV